MHRFIYLLRANAYCAFYKLANFVNMFEIFYEIMLFCILTYFIMKLNFSEVVNTVIQWKVGKLSCNKMHTKVESFFILFCNLVMAFLIAKKCSCKLKCFFFVCMHIAFLHSTKQKPLKISKFHIFHIFLWRKWDWKKNRLEKLKSFPQAKKVYYEEICEKSFRKLFLQLNWIELPF